MQSSANNSNQSNNNNNISNSSRLSQSEILRRISGPTEISEINNDDDNMTFNRHTSSGIQQIIQSQSQIFRNFQKLSENFPPLSSAINQDNILSGNNLSTSPSTSHKDIKNKIVQNNHIIQDQY